MGGPKNRDSKDRKDKDLGFTKEEEILLQDFSRNVSTKSSALFYGNAFIVSIIPLCKYLRSSFPIQITLRKLSKYEMKQRIFCGFNFLSVSLMLT